MVIEATSDFHINFISLQLTGNKLSFFQMIISHFDKCKSSDFWDNNIILLVIIIIELSNLLFSVDIKWSYFYTLFRLFNANIMSTVFCYSCPFHCCFLSLNLIACLIVNLVKSVIFVKIGKKAEKCFSVNMFASLLYTFFNKIIINMLILTV